MACAILVKCAWRMRFLWLSIFVGSLGVSVGGAEPGTDMQKACPPVLTGANEVLQQQYTDFRQAVEKGVFFRALVKHRGSPEGCRARVEASAVLLSYEFARGARLMTKRDAAIEFMDQEITGYKLKRGEAVSLLREAERDLFSPDGCGISWRNPPRKEAGLAAGHYALVYPGDVCNCQGRLTYQGGGLVTLGFRSAC